MGILDVFKRKSGSKEVARRQYAGVDTSRLFSDFVTSERSADSELRFTIKELHNR